VLVMNVDDYDIIFYLDFLRKAKIVLIPYLNRVMITSMGCPCFVPYCNIAMTNATKGGKSLISAIVIEKTL